jgi:hypothetical protein
MKLANGEAFILAAWMVPIRHANASRARRGEEVILNSAEMPEKAEHLNTNWLQNGHSGPSVRIILHFSCEI